MYFGVPVIARDTSAIAGTLGGSGILLSDNDSKIAAEMINRVITDETLRRQMVDNQKVRLKDFDNKVIKQQFLKFIKKITA